MYVVDKIFINTYKNTEIFEISLLDKIFIRQDVGAVSHVR